MTLNPIKNPPVIPPPGAAVKPGILTSLAMQDRAFLLQSSLHDGKWEPLTDLPAQMQRLLAGGIRVDEPDRTGTTALLYAIGDNNVDIAQLLLKSGADPNFVLMADPGTYVPLPATTPLIAAVEAYKNYFDTTLIRQLLEAGANPDYRSGGEYVNVPADADDPSTGQQNLLAGVTALHIAAENGYLSICKLLLDHGADPHFPRSDGKLPADIARDNVHKDIAALIGSFASRAKPHAPAATAK